MTTLNFGVIITLDSVRGLSIKYVALFWANFDPLPPITLCHTSWDRQKYVTHLGPPPIFSWTSTKNPDKSPLYKFPLNCSRGVLSGGLLSGRFCSGWFLSIPPSVRIHLLQQKGKHHFQISCMYDKKNV